MRSTIVLLAVSLSSNCVAGRAIDLTASTGGQLAARDEFLGPTATSLLESRDPKPRINLLRLGLVGGAVYGAHEFWKHHVEHEPEESPQPTPSSAPLAARDEPTSTSLLESRDPKRRKNNHINVVGLGLAGAGVYGAHEFWKNHVENEPEETPQPAPSSARTPSPAPTEDYAAASMDNEDYPAAPVSSMGDATAPMDNTGDATAPMDNSGDASAPMYSQYAGPQSSAQGLQKRAQRIRRFYS